MGHSASQTWYGEPRTGSCVGKRSQPALHLDLWYGLLDAFHLVCGYKNKSMLPCGCDHPNIINVNPQANQVGLGSDRCLRRPLLLPDARDDLGVIESR